MSSIALDTNILLLLVVGRTDRNFIGKHKRLSAYSDSDLDVLLRAVSKAERLITTPNCMTEVSNLCGFGVFEPMRTRIAETLGAFASEAEEHYVTSKVVCSLPAYRRIGLADSAWLMLALPGSVLISDDRALSEAMAANGQTVVQFEQLRLELRNRAGR